MVDRLILYHDHYESGIRGVKWSKAEEGVKRRWIGQLLSGLVHLNERGMIHGRLSMDCIFVKVRISKSWLIPWMNG